MGWLEGLAQGFMARKGEVEQQNIRAGELAQQRETTVYNALLNSKDPTAQALAVSGLVESTQPKSRKSGLQGWLGEREQSPIFQQLLQYTNTPQTTTTTTPEVPASFSTGAPQALPGGQVQSIPPSPSIQPTVSQPGASAAAPGTSAVQGGPPPAPSGYAQTAGPSGLTLSRLETPSYTTTQTRYPDLGLSAAAQTEAQQYGSARGHLEGILAATEGINLDPQSKRLMINRAMGFPEHYTTDTNGDVHLISGGEDFGVVAQGAGRASAAEAQIQSQANDLYSTGQYLTRAEALIAARQGAAAATTGKQQSAAVAGAVAAPMAAARLANMRARLANELAQLPEIQANAELKQRALNGQLTQEEASRIAAQLLANRPGATSDDFNDWVAALRGTPGSTAAPTAPTAPGAPPTITPPSAPGTVPAVAAAAAAAGAAGAGTTGTGAPPAVTTATGAPAAASPQGQPGHLPSGKSLYKLNAGEQTVLDTIEGAKSMMDRVMKLIGTNISDDLVTQTGERLHGIGQNIESRAGYSPSDPTYKELIPLIEHLRVFAGSPYLHGIKNGAYVQAVQDNIPEPTDSKARIRDKIANMQKNFKDIEDAIGSGKASATSGAPPAPSAPTTPAPAAAKASTQTVPNYYHEEGTGRLYKQETDGTKTYLDGKP